MIKLLFVLYSLACFADSFSNHEDCDPQDCSKLRIKCNLNQTADACLDKGLAYVLPDDCHCCGSCAEVEDVVEKCKDEIDCRLYKGGRDYPCDCTAEQVLVPADQKCYCCPKCVTRKEHCHHHHNHQS